MSSKAVDAGGYVIRMRDWSRRAKEGVDISGEAGVGEVIVSVFALNRVVGLAVGFRCYDHQECPDCDRVSQRLQLKHQRSSLGYLQLPVPASGLCMCAAAYYSGLRSTIPLALHVVP